MPANFSPCVLICNTLGCFLRLHALLSRMHNLQRHIRVCAHKNPKASQQGVASYLILTYCSYWILCPHAPLPSGTRSRRTKMFLLFTHRLITTDCAASLRCRHRCFLFSPPYRQVVNAKKKIKKKRYINSGTVSLSSYSRSSTSLLHVFIQQEVALLFFNLIKCFLLFPTRLNISDALQLLQLVALTQTLVCDWSLMGRRIYEEYLSTAINEP